MYNNGRKKRKEDRMGKEIIEKLGYVKNREDEKKGKIIKF